MGKKFRYFFEHTVFQRVDGVIKDHFKNYYEVIAEDSAMAHTQVPHNSILQVIKSMDNELLHDFRSPIVSTERRLRKKIGSGGRRSLTAKEYREAVDFEIIR